VEAQETAGAGHGEHESPYPDVFGDRGFIMNLTYRVRIHPPLPCTVLFEEEEWKVLYCATNRTKKVSARPYRIKQAVDYVGWLGGPKRAPRDGPPGVKSIWSGLQKLYTLLDYRELFDFMGQV
jgi:hypothetical protein